MFIMVLMTEEPIKTKKRSVHRSPAYPSVDLEKAIPLAQKLNEKFQDDAFSRDNAVTELGLQKGGDAFRKIAALGHFGLIDRKGSSYKVTSLTKQIIFPGDDEKIKQTAIENAAKNPKLYKTLIISYQGKQLPTALHHRLITNENFNQSVAGKVAKDFKKSMEFAGILKNGIMAGSEKNAISQVYEPQQPDSPIDEDEEIKAGDAPAKNPATGVVPFPLGPDITVNLSEKLVRDITLGKFGDKFAKALEALEKLGKGEKDGTSTSNAPDTSVEPD